MFKEWTKSGTASSVQEIVQTQTGLSTTELDMVWNTPISNLKKLADNICKCADELIPVTIFADYDADGITSAVILTKALNHIGITPKVMFPKRSTGYGISESAIDEIATGAVITVDNGIAAIAAIAKAKTKGLDVFVLDHHLPGDELPEADVIVNPHVYKENDEDFEDWCGAGLSYRLAKELVCDTAVLDELVQYAAIGTIADVVNLIKDNRTIVKEGLNKINSSKISFPIRQLLLKSGSSIFVDETTVGFKLGPMINASGRVKDDAELVYRFVMSGGDNALADEIYNLNEERKRLVSDAVNRARNIIVNECKLADRPVVVYDEETPEGIVGIVAGKICEEMGVPAIILTKSSVPGIAKGSARSTPEINIKELFDASSEFLETYGGHAGAAGLSLKKDKIDDFSYFINEKAETIEKVEQSKTYRLEIQANEIQATIEELKRYAPYGQGNPRIIFKINNFELTPRLGVFSKVIGENNTHLKIFGNKVAGIGFDMAEKFNSLGQPKALNLIGTLSENHFLSTPEAQIEIFDLEESSFTKEKTTLQKQLEAKLKKLF